MDQHRTPEPTFRDEPSAPGLSALSELRTLIARHTAARAGGKPAPVVTAIPRVSLMRVEADTTPFHTLQHPILGVVAQGHKRSLLGTHVVECGAGEYAVASLHLPVTATVTQASPERPFLGFGLLLDPVALASILLETPHFGPDGAAFGAPDGAAHEVREARGAGAHAGMAACAVTADLLDPILRLLRLLDRPWDIPVLAPLAERELLYRLLTGARGGPVAQVARASGPLSQVGRAIDWIRRHYARPLVVDELARTAGMSASSLYRHFKAATGLSPVAFHHQIRLQEARRLLLAADVDAARAGGAVGFASPSQFNREYKRQFGVTPRRDAALLRGVH